MMLLDWGLSRVTIDMFFFLENTMVDDQTLPVSNLILYDVKLTLFSLQFIIAAIFRFSAWFASRIQTNT